MTLQEEMEKALLYKKQCVADKHSCTNILGQAYAEWRKKDEQVTKAFAEIYRIQDLINKEGETA